MRIVDFRMVDNREEVKIVVTGAGMKREKRNLFPLCILSHSQTFSDAVEFGRFVGDITGHVKRPNDKDYDIFIPREARNTWSVQRIEDGTPSLFVDWSKEFSKQSMNTKDLDFTEVLSYWVKLTGDENIRKGLINSYKDE